MVGPQHEPDPQIAQPALPIVEQDRRFAWSGQRHRQVPVHTATHFIHGSQSSIFDRGTLAGDCIVVRSCQAGCSDSTISRPPPLACRQPDRPTATLEDPASSPIAGRASASFKSRYRQCLGIRLGQLNFVWPAASRENRRVGRRSSAILTVDPRESRRRSETPTGR